MSPFPPNNDVLQVLLIIYVIKSVNWLTLIDLE